MAFIIAGLGHDLNHPGNDNSFEIALNSQLVRDYTREAVLENYHAHNLLSLLNNPDNNVFQNLNAVKQKEMLEFIVEVSSLFSLPSSCVERLPTYMHWFVQLNYC